MGCVSGLLMVGLVLLEGNLESLDMNSSGEFLFLLLCLGVGGIFYTFWAFKIIEWIMRKLRGGVE